MICSGRQVELDSVELQTKTGLISKCLYINDLLNRADLSESSLDADPSFPSSGKVILSFLKLNDAQHFSFVHGDHFNASNNGTSSEPKQLRKNVSFSSDNGCAINVSSPSEEDLAEDIKNKSILKSGNNNLITGRTKVGFNVGRDSGHQEKSQNKPEAYEILVFRSLSFKSF
jgi:hypothetical protein